MTKRSQESGVVLVAVICLVAVTAVLSIGLLNESRQQVALTARKAGLEQAFYIAEGGAERAVAYIRQGGAVPNTITGEIGAGRFYTSILASSDETPTGGLHTVSGWVNINPNNSPDHQFMLLGVDGTSFTRSDLQQSQSDYSGTACLVHVKPKGNADQTTLVVDGTAYTLDRNRAYTFTGDAIGVLLSNDNRNVHGLAVGKWWIHLSGSGITINDDADADAQSRRYYTIYSVGARGDSRRLVILEGVHQASWAKYALWYHNGPGEIWIRSGETFDGPVHANTYIYLQGNPVFNALISSTRSGWGSGSTTGDVSFNAGYQLSAPAQSMASVSFPNLLNSASMVVTGIAAITLSGTNMLVTNGDRGWVNRSMPVPSNGLVYVKRRNNSNPGLVSLGGVLDGRLTIVADQDIEITNHVTYAAHPTNGSDDALGLIAKRDVVVRTMAPDHLNLFAHVIAEGSATASTATDGSFYVEDHDSSSLGDRGLLNVYGGIVQYYRGAVGTFGGWSGDTGYSKNYVFDPRFFVNPPPYYPVLTNEYQWKGWRDKPL